MKLQIIQQQEADQGILEKPICRIMKQAKPMLQILDSNTPTTHKVQPIVPSPRNGDGKMGFELEKGKEEEHKRRFSVDGWSEKEEEESGRERLKRHRVDVAREVWIPDIWGQENYLMDWIDCSAFDSGLAPKGIVSARAALVEEGRRAHSGTLSVDNTCR